MNLTIVITHSIQQWRTIAQLKWKIQKLELKPHLSFLWTYTILAEITLGTFIDQLLVRIVAIFTLKVVFHFLNESKGVWVIVKCINTSKLKIWVLPKNTFRMCKITAISTIVEPISWVTFFFTNISIIFTWVIFRCITKSEGMLILFIPCGLW